MLPPFVIVHMFCTLQNSPRNVRFAEVILHGVRLYMWEKQALAKVIGIQKKVMGTHSEVMEFQFGKNTIHCSAF